MRRPPVYARAWLAIPVVVLAIAAIIGVDLAQSQPPPARRIDSWSGLIVTCQADAKLALAADVCNGVVAEVKRQAGAGKVKFVALAAGDGPDIKTAKAKAAGFDDAQAIEMSINIRASDSTAAMAALDVDALSRQHIMPSRPGQPTQYAKIFTQSAVLSRDAGAWQEAVAPSTKQLLGMFFKIYLAPPPPVKK
jgi:hypothetical protein